MAKVFNKEEVQNKLQQLGALNACHRCSNRNFAILDGYSSLYLQPDLSNIGGLSLGGPVVPVIYVVCQKCGAVTPHAIGALGLLDQESTDNKDA
ncbi:hypothetical protein WJ590_004888 [Escherichia coli]|nr:hypothetical protein [Salmonella enterica]EHU4041705.1 hypothetical protein [Salmonella enterica subsp. enterica serovar Senftenberg]ELT9064839.1 hypothetical protein [Escherichia coli]EGQ4563205.1 hypothetical protein [Salmonella enterica]EGX9039921.1 hypothetical protein [Salmonella enterica]